MGRPTDTMLSNDEVWEAGRIGKQLGFTKCFGTEYSRGQPQTATEILNCLAAETLQKAAFRRFNGYHESPSVTVLPVRLVYVRQSRVNRRRNYF